MEKSEPVPTRIATSSPSLNAFSDVSHVAPLPPSKSTSPENVEKPVTFNRPNVPTPDVTKSPNTVAPIAVVDNRSVLL